MNAIPCLAWVKKGVAASNPEKIQLNPKELEEIIKQTQTELSNDDSDSNEEGVSTKKVENKQTNVDTSDEYNFANYDEEMGTIQCNIGSVALFEKDGKDPFITKEEDEDSEKEDDIIKEDDNLILLGHVEDDASVLEIFVYNEREGSLYCHHDILLSSFPLCIEWLNFDSTDPKPGNLCAIGSMTSVIEVWDLDLIDCLEPAYKLGQKASKKNQRKRIGHKDSVLSLAWNQNYTHVLASGSVDQTVLLWDLENTTPVTKLTIFDEKIQSLQWHPSETHQLLAGSADKMVRLFDCKAEKNLKSWQTLGEVEKVLWNHFDSNYVFAGTENGYLECFDVRNDQPLWQVKSHEKEVTGLSLSSKYPGLLVSTSHDGMIKVWELINNDPPSLVWEKKSSLGALLCMSSSPDSPFAFAISGDNRSHNFEVMDLHKIPQVRERFQNPAILSSLEETKTESEGTVMDVMEDMSSMNLDTGSHKNLQKKKKLALKQ